MIEMYFHYVCLHARKCDIVVWEQQRHTHWPACTLAQSDQRFCYSQIICEEKYQNLIANNKCADQPAHPHSQIHTFVIRYQQACYLCCGCEQQMLRPACASALKVESLIYKLASWKFFSILAIVLDAQQAVVAKLATPKSVFNTSRLMS